MLDIGSYIPETILLGCIMLQHFCGCNIWYLHIILFPTLNAVYITLVLSAVCVQCPTWLFSVVL